MQTSFNKFWFLLSIIFSLVVLGVNGASTEEPPAQPDIPGEIISEGITFNITETYRQKKLSKILVCDEKPHGTHPTPKEACEEFMAALEHPEEGDEPVCPCPKNLDPVDIDVDISIKDKSFNTPINFSNVCLFHCRVEKLKHFFDIGLIPNTPPLTNQGE